MRCGALSADVPGRCQKQLTKTLIVRLLKTHLFTPILDFQQNRIELVTRPAWLQIDPPYGTKLKSVSAGSFLWALDTSDRLYFRKEDPILPSWVHLPIASTTGEFAPSSATVKGISSAGNEVWGVLDNVTPTPSGGGVWNYVASAAGAGPVGGAVASVASQASGGECN